MSLILLFWYDPHQGLLTVDSPYMEPAVVDWALQETTRADCIGERDIRLVLRGERVAHMTGKVVLREAFDTLSSWRRKGT